MHQEPGRGVCRRPLIGASALFVAIAVAALTKLDKMVAYYICVEEFVVPTVTLEMAISLERDGVEPHGGKKRHLASAGCVTVKSQPVNIVHVQACHEMPHFRCIALHCISIVTLPCSHNVAAM